MNKQLIEKIIKSNDEICPELSYENPLLDRNIAKALSKSFVKILSASHKNSKINTNLRLSILESIKKMCQIQPEDHIKVDENLTELLTEFHTANYKKKTVLVSADSVNKTLDAFLLRRMLDCEIVSNYKSELNPETTQSLINLKQNGVFDLLSNEIIHWDVKDSKYMCIAKELFNDIDTLEKTQLLDDISIKMIPEIEKLLLQFCFNLFEENSILESLFTHNSLHQLIKMCVVSSKCFQICCAILNFMFITSNYSMHIQTFVSKFIDFVKMSCTQVTFSVLYPTHLGHIALLLDFNEKELPPPLRIIYIHKTIEYLRMLHINQESDLIMLLSHFPRWFDIYFDPEYHD